MADNCNDRAAPEIEVPDISEDEYTKEDILRILGYEELSISTTDSEGTTVTAVVPGYVE